MDDLDKLIKAISLCLTDHCVGEECPYSNIRDCVNFSHKKALKYLKEYKKLKKKTDKKEQVCIEQ